VLCLWSLQLLPGLAGAQAWQSGVLLAGMLLAGLYAAATLSLQSRRRRKQADITLVFWRGAMLSLLALAFSAMVFELLPQLGEHARAPLWLGVLALPGVFLSVIMGMLYKIMPFLNWLHLQRHGGTVTTQPNMKQMIPERAMRGQMRLHFAALVLLLAAVLWPALALPAGLAFSASCLWLEWNLVGAARVYARFRDQIRAAAGDCRGAMRIRYVDNPEYQKGSILSLWRARDILTQGTTIVMDGDVLFPTEFLSRLIASPHASALLLDQSFTDTGEEVKLYGVGDRVIALGKKFVPQQWDVIGEGIGFFKCSPAHAPEYIRLLAESIEQTGGVNEYEDALHHLLGVVEVGWVDVTGLPWTEVDFVEDLRRAESQVLPRIERLGH